MQPRDFLAFVAAIGFTACTSDLPAPNNYEPSSAGVDSAGGVQLACDDIPDAAVGAEFDYTPAISGAEGATLLFEAPDLPGGLALDPASGRITGVPTTEGSFTIGVSVTIDGIAMEETMCELQVNPALQVDLERVVGEVPFCLRPGGDTLHDVIVEGTGDGSDPTCTWDGGSGDGRPPAGISVGLETCEIEGTIEEDRYGTWVFIVRGEQNGVSVHVPYCVTNEEQQEYDVTVDHSGLADRGIDGTLIPIMRRFNPSAAINFGSDGDPRFEIIGEDACGANACFYGYAFMITVGSPFVGDVEFRPNDTIDDPMSGQPIGFFHSLFLSRPDPVEEAFRTRPWALTMDVAYCLADSNGDPDNDQDGPCEGNNIRPNAGAEFEISVLMVPG
jgi:hypothetical protein